MRIVVTTPNWTLNGVNTFNASLVRRLRARGHEVTLLLTGSVWRDDKPIPLPADLEAVTLQVPLFATWGARWRALRRYLETVAPCVYLPNHDVAHSAISPVLASAVGIVGVVHSDDSQHYEHVRRLGRWWNAAVGVSTAVTERVRGFPELGGARVEHIPYGVEVTPVPRDARLREGPLRILYAGRLEAQQKRTGMLLDIAEALHVRRVAFTMTLAGDGPMRPQLEARARRLACAGAVHFAGTVAFDAMGALYREHDAFLLPSAFEGLPLALLEAMGDGVVPVVSDIASGIPEIVRHGENGYRIPGDDVEAFAGVLARLAADRASCGAMGERARQTVLAGPYDIGTMAVRYEALLADVWDDVRTRRYVRPPGPILPPPSLDWRSHVRAPLAALRDQLVGPVAVRAAPVGARGDT